MSFVSRSRALLFRVSLVYFAFYLYSHTEDTYLHKRVDQGVSLIAPYYEPVKPYVLQSNQVLHEQLIDPVNERFSVVYSEHLAEHVNLVNERYVSKYYQVLDEKVIQPASTSYIKPAYEEAKRHYENTLYPAVVKYGDIASAQIKVYALKALVEGKAFAEYSRIKSYELAVIFKHNLITVYVPTFCDYCNKILRFLRREVEPKVISFYQRALQPYLTKLFYAAKLDVVVEFLGEYHSKLVQSSYYTSAKDGVVSFYHLLKSNNYDQVETKTNFVKAEFNKIFDAGFKLKKDFGESWRSSNELIKEKLYYKKDTSVDSTEASSGETSFDTSAVSSAVSTVAETIEGSISATEEEEFEEETITITSTSTKTLERATVTSREAIEATKIESHASSSTDFWKAAVSKTCEAAIGDFVEEVKIVEKATIELYKPKLTAELQELSKSINNGYKDVTAIISKINGTDISRQEFRDVLSDLRSDLGNRTELVKDILKELSNNTSQFISTQRAKVIETLDDFSSFAVQEISREFVSDKKDEEDYWKNWKELDKIKEVLYDTRDNILNLKPELKDLDKMVRDIQKTVSILTNESGEHLALLRAKANLAFQLREERERLDASASAASAASTASDASDASDASTASDASAASDSVSTDQPAVSESSQVDLSVSETVSESEVESIIAETDTTASVVPVPDQLSQQGSPQEVLQVPDDISSTVVEGSTLIASSSLIL